MTVVSYKTMSASLTTDDIPMATPENPPADTSDEMVVASPEAEVSDTNDEMVIASPEAEETVSDTNDEDNTADDTSEQEDEAPPPRMVRICSRTKSENQTHIYHS